MLVVMLRRSLRTREERRERTNRSQHAASFMSLFLFAPASSFPDLSVFPTPTPYHADITESETHRRTSSPVPPNPTPTPWRSASARTPSYTWYPPSTPPSSTRIPRLLPSRPFPEAHPPTRAASATDRPGYRSSSLAAMIAARDRRVRPVLHVETARWVDSSSARRRGGREPLRLRRGEGRVGVVGGRGVGGGRLGVGALVVCLCWIGVAR